MGKEIEKIKETKKQDTDTRPAVATGTKEKTGAASKAGFKSIPKSTPSGNTDSDGQGQISNLSLSNIDDLAKEQGLPDWEKAAFFRAAGWAPGKKVASAPFGLALAKFRNRQLGGGKI